MPARSSAAASAGPPQAAPTTAWNMSSQMTMTLCAAARSTAVTPANASGYEYAVTGLKEGTSRSAVGTSRVPAASRTAASRAAGQLPFATTAGGWMPQQRGDDQQAAQGPRKRARAPSRVSRGPHRARTAPAQLQRLRGHRRRPDARGQVARTRHVHRVIALVHPGRLQVVRDVGQRGVGQEPGHAVPPDLPGGEVLVSIGPGPAHSLRVVEVDHRNAL